MRNMKDHKNEFGGRNMKMGRKLLLSIFCICSVLLITLLAYAVSPGPTVSIISPIEGAKVSKPSVKVLVQIWDADGPVSVDNGPSGSQVKRRIDAGSYETTGIELTSRVCGTNCRIFQYVWDLSGYADDSTHRIRFIAYNDARAFQASRTPGLSITVKGEKTGDGMLMVRDGSSQLCMDCHVLEGHSSQNANAGGTTPSDYGKWETICLDCHTAHSTTNIDLIRTTVNNYSYLATTAIPEPVRFYNRTGNAAYSYVTSSATGTNITGVCQVCHTQTKNPTTSDLRWVATGNPENGHYQDPTENCSRCHLHTEGFRGRDCFSCHKTPPATGRHIIHGESARFVYGSLVIDSTADKYGYDCGICHSGIHQNTGGTESNPHTAEVIFAGVAIQDPVTGLTATYSPDSTPSTTDGYNGYTFNYGEGTCSNTYCHGNYPGSGKNFPISHTEPSDPTPCGTLCHNASNDEPSIPITGSHERHVTSSARLTGETKDWHTYNREYSCTLCHGDLTGVGTPSSSGAYSSYIVADKTKHVNGYVDWHFNTADFRARDGFYSIASGTAVPSDGVTPRAYGYCTVYCHSNVQGNLGYGPPNSYSTMTWSTDRNRCKYCHVDPSTSGTGTKQHGTGLSTGSHGSHYRDMNRNACDDPTPCLICHNWSQEYVDTFDACTEANCDVCHDTLNGTTSEKTKHVNGFIEVKIDTFYGGTYNKGFSFNPGIGYGDGADPNAKCSNTYCHSDGTSVKTGTLNPNSSLDWGTQTYRKCYDCHSNTYYSTSDYRKAAPINISGTPPNAHQLHLRQSGSTVEDPSCAHCHYSTTATNTSISSLTTHMNKFYNVDTGLTYPAWEGSEKGASKPVTIGSFTFAYGSSAVSTCTNVSCHPDGLGTNTAMWSNTYYCTECHKVDMSNTAGYHHVMNFSALTSRVYPMTYPAETANDTNRKCIMCHVDHTTFNPMLNANSPGRAYNLRTSILSAPTAYEYYTNMDFDSAQTYGGICTSCHKDVMTKNTVLQKDDGTTKTPVITKAIYDPSSHQYMVTSTFVSTQSGNFLADCSKCHNTGNDTKTFQNNSSTPNVTPKFANHDSTPRRLLSTLGATTVDPLEEKFCFRCHSTASNNIGGTKKSATVNDWYGAVTNMTARSTDTFASFYSTPDGTPATKTYGHMLWNYSGKHKPSPTDETQSYISSNKHVECDDCHNVHAATTPLHTKGVAAGNTVSKLLTSVPAVTANYAVPASSTLWLRSTTPYEARPNTADPAGDTFQGGTWQARELLTSQGSSVEVQLGSVSPAGFWRATSFVSPPVADTKVIGAGTWTLRLWALESALSANSFMRATIYVWQSSDTKGTVILAPTTYPKTDPSDPTGIVELTTVSTAYTWNVNGSAVTLNPGDRIVVELEIQTTGSPVGLWQYRWNGAGTTDDSKVTLPTPVSFVSYTAASSATKEYEICFKCHSGANPDYSNWGGTYNASPLAWTDVGMEFNPKNKSGHPVVTGLSNYTNSSAPKALATAQLVSPWNVNVGTQTMYCSDCHSTDSAVSSGPHASSVRWMLAGTNKAWPYTSAANNGTSSGTFFTLGNLTTGNGTTNGLFCYNCHPANFTSNNAHNEGGHTEAAGGNPTGPYACVVCHIRVPHGGKLSRLISADNTGTGLPARYYPDGNGGGRITNYLRKYTKAASRNGYGTGSCYAGCYADHNNSGNGTETW